MEGDNNISQPTISASQRRRNKHDERQKELKAWTRRKVGRGAEAGFWIGRVIGMVAGVGIAVAAASAGEGGADFGWILGLYIGEAVGAGLGLLIGGLIGLFTGEVYKRNHEVKLEARDIAIDREMSKQQNLALQQDGIDPILLMQQGGNNMLPIPMPIGEQAMILPNPMLNGNTIGDDGSSRQNNSQKISHVEQLNQQQGVASAIQK